MSDDIYWLTDGLHSLELEISLIKAEVASLANVKSDVLEIERLNSGYDDRISELKKEVRSQVAVANNLDRWSKAFNDNSQRTNRDIKIIWKRLITVEKKIEPQKLIELKEDK